MRILVSGGAGFKGSAVCRHLVGERGATVLNVDRLGPTSSLASLDAITFNPRYSLRKADVCHRSRMAALVAAFAPDAVIHLAGTGQDIDATIPAHADADSLGTWSLLAAATQYWSALSGKRRDAFRFVRVSKTDTTSTADQLALTWQRSHGLPVIVSRSAMSYGPHQGLDHLVPQLVLAARGAAPMPVAAGGSCVSDWLHVEDHARALVAMVDAGVPGAVYDVGAGRQQSDLLVAERIAAVMDRYTPNDGGHQQLITFVANETGPMRRRALDPARLRLDTGWQATETLESGLARTVHWYLDNEAWWRPLRDARRNSAIMGLANRAA